MTQRPDRGFLDGFNTVWGKQRSRAAHPPQQRNTATSQGTPSPTYRAETSKKRDGSPSSETPVEGPKGEAQREKPSMPLSRCGTFDMHERRTTLQW